MCVYVRARKTPTKRRGDEGVPLLKVGGNEGHVHDNGAAVLTSYLGFSSCPPSSPPSLPPPCLCTRKTNWIYQSAGEEES